MNPTLLQVIDNQNLHQSGTVSRQVMAIGKFDGVHLGHQAVLDVAREQMGQDSILSVFTFSPHPTYVLTGREEYQRVLTPNPMKTKLLGEYGVSRVYVAHFGKTYANITAEAFVKEQLAPLELKRVVVGEDFRFGQGGKADVHTLSQLCETIGVAVSIVPASLQNGRKISSSEVRSYLEEGSVERATHLLGRRYAISGQVIHGDKLGRQLGFPTANLGNIEEYVLPKSGVHVVAVRSEDANIEGFGVLNAGFRPTVQGTAYRLEVHILDFEREIYGTELEVQFISRLRDEQRFENVDALRAQIAADVRQAMLFRE